MQRPDAYNLKMLEGNIELLLLLQKPHRVVIRITFGCDSFNRRIRVVYLEGSIASVAHLMLRRVLSRH